MRTPVQSRSESSADRMLAAALDLLAEGGLAAVTIAAVARRAGTSNGSLYHRFGDRTGLLVAAQARALARIEAATSASFAAADAEPDDDRAVGLLARAALGIFATERAPLRTFLVEGRSDPRLGPPATAATHRLGDTVSGWLVERFATTPEQAGAAWRVLFALGASQALFDDGQVAAQPLDGDALGEALARAVLAVVRDRPAG
ncbi:TetR/AcrR family transcriptional regulator [Nocardioides kribbensis]|uniref:TetR/AcrR family transcriptional regulator n=1 Tax=Nocardioides kribbensis TaxID=305517 RepID=UPI0032D9E7D4